MKKPVKTMEVEEYLVKFKNFSYLHCQWLTEVELLKGDKRVSNKVRSFQSFKSLITYPVNALILSESTKFGKQDFFFQYGFVTD